MSMSKEERDYWREQVELAEAKDRVWMEINISTAYRWLDDLDARNEQIVELEEQIAELDTENQRIAELVSEVYLEITNGEISKPGTDPTVVLDYARESNERDHAEDLWMKDERIAELTSEVERLRQRERWLRDVLACLPESVKEEALSDAKAMREDS